MGIRSLKTQSFNKAFEHLPKDIQMLATQNFKAWRQDPGSVKIKPLNCTSNEVVSAEINYRYRALGVKGKDKDGQSVYVWFWLGSHEGYNKMIHCGLGLQGQIHTIRKKYLSSEVEHEAGHDSNSKVAKMAKLG